MSKLTVPCNPTTKFVPEVVNTKAVPSTLIYGASAATLAALIGTGLLIRKFKKK